MTHSPPATIGSLAIHSLGLGRIAFVDDQGATSQDVLAVRNFPISDPNRFISILDSRGREVGLIADLEQLPSDMADLVRRQLDEREFLPQIQRIVNVQMNKEPHEWEVLTNRGAVQFLMRDEDIRRLGPTRAILVDLHGVRYYIPDSRLLDAKSRRYLTQYL